MTPSLALAPFVLAVALADLPEDRGPNTLTPEQIDAGWLLLFDGHSTFGWTVEADDPGAAVSVADGAMTIAGPALVRSTTAFGRFRLELQFRNERERQPPATLDLVRPSGSRLQSTGLGELGGRTPPGHWNDLSVEVGPDGLTGEVRERSEGATLTGSVSGPVLDEGPLLATVGLRVPEGAKVSVRGVTLRPLGLAPIFNGEDLSGWNVLEGGRSVFSVTEQGHLNVKDGRGDIQTEGRYDDFVLQLDVFVNGEDLNSGIFLRAIPGAFWSGYESQIRNEFVGDDRAEPVDFGTGGIYRRQPARRIVAEDFAWFTKTIVARDAHFAVWVDGYQVSEWTDTREPADNGRNGLKTTPGVISIQGHDPTTDLSFRDIRIAELPAEAPAGSRINDPGH